jgi:PAS domain S-box-containing protein
MITAPVPTHEPDRLAALHRYDILDTAPDDAFDDLTALAAHICGTPMALISLVDANREWFKSKVGVQDLESPRDIAFCAHGILQEDIFVVPDALVDDRFSDNPMVTGDPHVRFYAGASLVTADGYALGMLCVKDIVPRDLRPDQVEALRILGHQVIAQIELRQRIAIQEHLIAEATHREQTLRTAEHALEAERALLRTLVNALPDYIYVKDDQSRFVVVNTAQLALLGVATPEAVIGKTDFDFFPRELAERYYADERAIVVSGQPLLDRIEPLLDQEGNHKWLLTIKVPVRDQSGAVTGVVGMGRDITALKQAEDGQARLREEIIRTQEAAIAQLSTPLIPISERVMVMPLIGTLDSRRAQQVLDTLLNGIAMSHATVAILDITGVPVVDSEIANGLIRAAQAVRLLGAQVVLTGIRPEVAQTLVGLGTDLGGVITRSSLQSGIAFALGQGID